jgi:uncharacterized protein YjbI with pentapeptide repeats
MKNLRSGHMKNLRFNFNTTVITVTNSYKNADIRGEIFKEGQDLSNLDFTNTQINSASFKKAILNNSDFTKTDNTAYGIPPNVTFKESSLINVKFRDSYLENSDFTEANLTGADFTNALLRSANFTGANLTNVNFTNAKNLSFANFTGANLTGAIFEGAVNIGFNTNFTGANLTGADFTGKLNFSNTIFTGANLTGADFTGANLTGANLTGANLTGANLTGANLTGANLTGANLTGANLTGANLTGANFTGANLTGADFTGANLTGANLTGAICKDCIFNEIDFTNIDFSGTLKFEKSGGPDESKSTVNNITQLAIQGGDTVDAIWINNTKYGGDGGSKSQTINVENIVFKEIVYHYDEYRGLPYIIVYLKITTSDNQTIQIGTIRDSSKKQTLKNVRLDGIEVKYGLYLDRSNFILKK